MIFIDTSALYALADRGDKNHENARTCFQTIVECDEKLLTHNYVLVETMALLQRRAGLEVALSLARDASLFEIDWVDEELHRESVVRLARTQRRQLSLVDQVSFLVMERRAVTVAFAFDADFSTMGFQLYGG